MKCNVMRLLLLTGSISIWHLRSLVGWVTCDPRVAMLKFATTAWVQELTLQTAVYQGFIKLLPPTLTFPLSGGGDVARQ